MKAVKTLFGLALCVMVSPFSRSDRAMIPALIHSLTR